MQMHEQTERVDGAKRDLPSVLAERGRRARTAELPAGEAKRLQRDREERFPALRSQRRRKMRKS